MRRFIRWWMNLWPIRDPQKAISEATNPYDNLPRRRRNEGCPYCHVDVETWCFPHCAAIDEADYR